MRLIDADEVRLQNGFFEKVTSVPKFYEWLDSLPTVDAEQVTRCKDCFWYTDSTKAVGDGPNGEVIAWCICLMFDEIMPENGYCSKGQHND